MIQQLLSIDNYATEERKARRKGSKSTQEFFTPYEIVKKMAEDFKDLITNAKVYKKLTKRK